MASISTKARTALSSRTRTTGSILAALTTVVAFLLLTNAAEARDRSDRYRSKRPSKHLASTQGPRSDGTVKSDRAGGNTKGTDQVPAGRRMGAAANAGLIYFGPGYGAETWANSSRHMQFGLQILHAEAELSAADQAKDADKGPALLNEYMTVALFAVKAQGRWYLSETFYTSGGLSYNQMSGEYGYTIGDSEEKLTRTYEASAILAHFGIGNQWRIGKSLVIGCEWVSLAGFLSNSITAGIDTSTVTSTRSLLDSDSRDDAYVKEFDSEEFNSRVDSSLRKQMQFTAAVLTLGMEF